MTLSLAIWSLTYSPRTLFIFFYNCREKIVFVVIMWFTLVMATSIGHWPNGYKALLKAYYVDICLLYLPIIRLYWWMRNTHQSVLAKVLAKFLYSLLNYFTFKLLQFYNTLSTRISNLGSIRLKDPWMLNTQFSPFHLVASSITR